MKIMALLGGVCRYTAVRLPGADMSNRPSTLHCTKPKYIPARHSLTNIFGGQCCNSTAVSTDPNIPASKHHARKSISVNI